ncbi:MAG: ABC transporter permease [Planctomycetota bacterium]|jgi:lipoprotein-releasing system permease protein
MKQLSLFLCFKYLCGKKIVLLSIGAVAMSCALLITVASLFTGFIEAIENSATEHLGDIVIAAPAGLKISQYNLLIGRLEEGQQIDAATAVLSSQGLLHMGKGTGDVRAVRIWGIEAANREKVSPFADSLIQHKNSNGPVTFAVDDTEQLGGFVGIGLVARPDEVTDEYDFGQVKASIGRGVALSTGTKELKRKTIKFVISDVVFSGIYEFDKDFVYLPIDTLAEKLYPEQGKVADMIQIKLGRGVQPEAALAVVRGIWRNFAEKELGWSNYAISLTKITTSGQMQARLIAEYRKQMGMLMLIFGVVSAGVVLLIFCIFYLIVMTKQKDIAIVKSCGLGSGAVWVMFVAFGVIIGLVGSGLGIATGYLVTKNVNSLEHSISVLFGLKLWKSSTYMFDKIPNQVNWESVVWVGLAAVLAAALGALIPALTAARVRPVRILRYE